MQRVGVQQGGVSYWVYGREGTTLRRVFLPFHGERRPLCAEQRLLSPMHGGIPMHGRIPMYGRIPTVRHATVHHCAACYGTPLCGICPSPSAASVRHPVRHLSRHQCGICPAISAASVCPSAASVRPSAASVRPWETSVRPWETSVRPWETSFRALFLTFLTLSENPAHWTGCPRSSIRCVIRQAMTLDVLSRCETLLGGNERPLITKTLCDGIIGL